MNAIYPVPPPLELAPIVTEIDRQLRGRLRQFNITCDERGLALFGEAPSFYVKQLAQHAVGRMTPVPIVRNEIEVVYPLSTSRIQNVDFHSGSPDEPRRPIASEE